MHSRNAAENLIGSVIDFRMTRILFLLMFQSYVFSTSAGRKEGEREESQDVNYECLLLLLDEEKVYDVYVYMEVGYDTYNTLYLEFGIQRKRFFHKKLINENQPTTKLMPFVVFEK